MDRQLVLIEQQDKEWQLDDRTREIGRHGLAAAREALRVAHRAGLEVNGSSRAAA